MSDENSQTGILSVDDAVDQLVRERSANPEEEDQAAQDAEDRVVGPALSVLGCEKPTVGSDVGSRAWRAVRCFSRACEYVRPTRKSTMPPRTTARTREQAWRPDPN